MMRRSLLSALAGLATLAACGADSATRPDSLVGTYTLQTVNGRALPQTIHQDADGTEEITGGRVHLTEDRRFHYEMDRRLTSRGSTTAGTMHAFGTYVLRGNTVILGSNGGLTVRMVISDGTLTQAMDALTLVYRR